MKRRLAPYLKLLLLSFLLSISILSISLLHTTTGNMPVALAAHVPPTPTPAPTPPPGTPWLLESYVQKTCDVQGNPPVEMVTYYAVWINGTWKHQITAQITHAPAGTQTWSFYNPIPPGSSNGIGSLADIAVQIPSNTPLGTYTLQLVASDGTLKQSVPVTLVVQTSCGHY